MPRFTSIFAALALCLGIVPTAAAGAAPSASPGSAVEATADEPLEVRLPDGVVVSLEPGARGVWHTPGKLPAENNHWARGYHFELQCGAMSFVVPSEPRGGHAFLVSTAAGTLTGWRGSVHVDADGNTTAAAIYEGALVVGSNGQGFPVFEPTGVVLRKSANPRRDPLPGTPDMLDRAPLGAAQPMTFASDDDRATIGFAWEPVSGASAYRVEVARDEAMHDVLLRATTASTTYALEEPGTTGRYFARVRAVDAMGIAGSWSSPRALRVVRVRRPAGAVVANDGAIVLPEGARVAISDPSGLEAALETVEIGHPRAAMPLPWHAAPEAIGLGATGDRVLHLRDATLGAETELVLARRALHARVAVGPARARWPGPPVEVTVVLDDPSRRVDVTTEPVSIEVTVNQRPVAVEWWRSGARLSARIASQPSLGPWMVRVTVRDAGGDELRSGFLEIDRAD